MNRKQRTYYGDLYLRALSNALVLGCELNLAQFAASHGIDAEELECLRSYLESQSVEVES